MTTPIDDLLGDRTILYQQDNYIIVNSSQYTGDNIRFRVINLATGDESQLYSIPECVDILRLAIAKQLLGSFN